MKYVFPACICLASWVVLPFGGQPFGMALLMVAACVQGGLVYALFRRTDTGRYSLGMGTVLVISLMLRLPFLLSPPLLSDDINRYLYDGMVQQAGESPYAFSPEDCETSDPIVADLASKVNHPELVTLYPPAAQLFFRLAAPMGITGMKTLLVTADMAVVCLFLILSQRLSLPRHRVILYAWNPLVVWEIAWSGHIDALALPFLLGAAGLVRGEYRPETILAGCLFAVAFWVKLVPVILCPFFFLVAKQRSGWFVVGGVVASLMLVVPYLPNMGNALGSLVVYGTTWEFSGFLFRSLRDLTGMNLIARAAVVLIFTLGAVGLFFRQWRTWDVPFAFCGWAIFLWLLTTPTLHPWYALYLALFLPFMVGAQNGAIAPFLLTLTPLMGYGVLTEYFAHGVWVEGPWTPFFIFGIPVTMWVISPVALPSNKALKFVNQLKKV